MCKCNILVPNPRQTFCEFKGVCGYYDVKVDDKYAKGSVWYYSNPPEKFKPITNYVSFYASMMDECIVDGEKVIPQKSNFYGGWINSWIDGGKKGFKGPPGTYGW